MQNKLKKEFCYKTLVPVLKAISRTQYFFCLTITILILLSISIHSQQANLPFEDVSVDQGMPTAVSRILKDRTGYLWFATLSGLYKYNGYSFEKYKHDLDDTTSLIENTLASLYEDKAGVLWIGSWIGFEKFDHTTGTFLHYRPNPSAEGKDWSNMVWSICEDKFGGFWIGSGDGLYKFDRATEKFTTLRHDSTDPSTIACDGVQAIYEDNEGSLWFGTGAGLDRLDFKTGKFIHYWNIPGKKWVYESMYWINSVFIDEANIFWLGTNGGLVEFNPKTGEFSNYLHNPNNPLSRVTSICRDVLSGFLWIGTLDGLFLFDKKSKKFTRYNSEGHYVYFDRLGILWIGTNTGIKKIDRTKQLFKKYPMNNIAGSVKNGKDGFLWIFDNDIEKYLKFDIRKEQFVPYSFGNDELYFVFPEGDLAFLTKDGGLRIQDSLGYTTMFLDPSKKKFINTLNRFLCKSNKGYWAGDTPGDLYFMNPKTNQVLKVNDLKGMIDIIYEDKLGMLWIATYMGKLHCYDKVKDTWTEFISDIRNPSSISGRSINQIYEDKKGRLWFASNSGLNRYKRDTKSFINFTEKNGLLSSNICGILEDDHGYLWLKTTKGISKFDPETNHFKNYDVSFGLAPSVDFVSSRGCKTRNGEMYFGGVKGFTRFHPDSVKDNPFIPPIVITSFKKFDKPYPFSDEIRLTYDENFISFEFAALSYISPERNQYTYKLEGLDKDWVFSGTRRYASYTNLDPGEYVFRVKGSNNDGVWNEAGTSMAIIISPPWWRTAWAYIFYVLFILGIIYFTWKMQLKRISIKHENEMNRFEAQKLHEVDEIKSRFFTNISHEFRTPLTLILGPVKQMIEIIKDGKMKDELSIVHKNANKLLGLVNQLLDISKLESGNMKLQTVPQNVIPLLKGLVLSFSSYAERKRITLNFNSSEDEIIAYVDKDKIEKIITNVLSNAFKFTPEGGRIEVNVRSDDKYVNVIVSDTGIGISKERISKIFDRFYQVDGSHTREQEGTGIGLALTKELVELHKGKIEVESEEGKGTRFTISIPLGKEHLKPEEIVEPDKDEDKEYEKDKIITEFDEDIKLKAEQKIDAALFEKESLPLLLIVEDNFDVRNYIKDNLKKDFRILEAIDGEDGWNKSIESGYAGPDLIVSDVMMPKMDGFELCNKLKIDERTSHIPVILLTAKASSTDKIEGYETGADDYIMKPFEPEELRARIKNLIEQRKRIHQHFQKNGIFELDKSKITSVDKKFLQKAFDIIMQNIADSSFSVELFAEHLLISKSLLHKKLVSLTGESPGELVRRVRLKKAADLIEREFGNLSEIALEVGFNNPAYFSECFRKQFGISPSQYQQRLPNNN